MQALLLIDIQNDFLPGGALPIPEGDQVIEVANRAMEHAEHVVATQDWHPADHGSFASQHDGVEVGERILLAGLPQTVWPDHCVQETHGADLAAALHRDRIEYIARKGTDRTIDSYSGFFDNGQRRSTGLDDYLRSQGIVELTVMGLATDYCVKSTVLDAIKLGYVTRVRLDGCRGVNLLPRDVASAVDTMRAAGAEILTGDSST